MSILKAGNFWRLARGAGNDLRGAAFDPVLAQWVFCGTGPGPGFAGEVVVATSAGLIAASPSFAVWGLTGTEKMNSVYSNGAGLYWMVGENEQTYRSTDGTFWVSMTIPGTPRDPTRIVFGPTTLGDIFVATGPNVAAHKTSAGADTWTVIDGNVDNQQDLALDPAVSGPPPNERWVSVGGTTSDGTIRVSTGGIAWGAKSSEFTEAALGVDHGNGKWVAVGENGLVATSATGLTGSWTEQTPPTIYDLNAVLHIGGDRWVAVGNNGVILHSGDNAATWAAPSAEAFGSDLAALAYDPVSDVIAATGTNGVVMTSQPLEVGDLAAVTPQPEPIIANPRISQEAVSRLVSQFRSGFGEPE